MSFRPTGGRAGIYSKIYMTRVFIAVGSNLGNRRQNLKKAKALLKKNQDVRFLRSSPVYETLPIGGPPQGKYLNAVWEIETELKAEDLLKNLMTIEKSLGREREGRNFPRTLDLDILFYGHRLIRQKNLIVPHPRLHKRTFVLKPLVDLHPRWVHPQLRKTVKTLLEELLENHQKT